MRAAAALAFALAMLATPVHAQRSSGTSLDGVARDRQWQARQFQAHQEQARQAQAQAAATMTAPRVGIIVSRR
jgi:hypothetical protein